MKTLLVLRHAKAEADSSDGHDLHRALALRGRKDAELAGKTLRKLGLVPDRILSSPSTRTRETVEIVVAKLKESPPVVYEDSIYDASVGALVHVLRAQEDSDCLLLVGHNPGLEQLLERLVSGGRATVSLPTCGMARVDFPVDNWNQIVEQPGELVWLLTPDVLKSL